MGRQQPRVRAPAAARHRGEAACDGPDIGSARADAGRDNAPVSVLDDAPQIQPADRAAWRAWLQANHATTRGAWLVMWRPGAARGDLDYEAAIEEALCFGWVDATAGSVDDRRTRLYFSPRRPRSPWAATNKARVARLIEQGRMTPAGLAAIDRATQDGSWTVLDGAERLEIPPDLATALADHPPAAATFAGLPRSARKQMLGWVAMARRPATRAKRITRIVDAAARGERARG